MFGMQSDDEDDFVEVQYENLNDDDEDDDEEPCDDHSQERSVFDWKIQSRKSYDNLFTPRREPGPHHILEEDDECELLLKLMDESLALFLSETNKHGKEINSDWKDITPPELACWLALQLSCDIIVKPTLK